MQRKLEGQWLDWKYVTFSGPSPMYLSHNRRPWKERGQKQQVMWVGQKLLSSFANKRAALLHSLTRDYRRLINIRAKATQPRLLSYSICPCVVPLSLCLRWAPVNPKHDLITKRWKGRLTERREEQLTTASEVYVDVYKIINWKGSFHSILELDLLLWRRAPVVKSAEIILFLDSKQSDWFKV